MENGKIISKGDVLVGLKTHRYITKGKEYSVFDVNYEHNLFVFQDDTGDYSCYYFSDIGKSLKLKEKSLVGRYLKALCDNPNKAGCYKEGDYIEIIKDNLDGSVGCNEVMVFGQKSYDWECSGVELMPEGFKPSGDAGMDNLLEQGLKFQDEVNEAFRKTREEEETTKPTQYQIGIDTFERAEANMTKEELLACVRFNIDKYTWRKKGQDEDDFKKIIDYCNYAIKQLNK